MITVRAVDGDDCVRVLVIDDGIGMDKDELLALRHTVSVGGHVTENDNGFGMANVAERLRMNYGETYGLTVNSEYGEGTTVEVRFPKKKNQS